MPKVSTTDSGINIEEADRLLGEVMNDPMGGWFKLPFDEEALDLSHIKSIASRIQASSNYLVCIGIGGSYLGHKALLSALSGGGITKLLFAGNSLSSYEILKIFEEIGHADYSVLVISKSGTTLEPATAFRIFKKHLIAKYGEREARSRIFVTTDAAKGRLFEEASHEEYERFVIPDNLGGRFSVLSPVGLLPLAVAGVDIDAIIAGAREEAEPLLPENRTPLTLSNSDALKYAYARHFYRNNGADTEVLAVFEERLRNFSEWWKQLFGESEGKNQSGVFPASVVYSADLHSLGQYLQEGRRNIFETVVKITAPLANIPIPNFVDDSDGLSYLEGKNLDFVQKKATDATIAAHRNGGIGVIEIEIPDLSEKTLGSLIYFFELSCAISAKLAGVNPFDQPGVEAYKSEMFRLLGRD